MTNALEDRLLHLLREISSSPLLHPPEGVDLSPPAIALLSWVSRSPGCGVLDIANGLRLSPPTISVGIRRLAKHGWLERRSDPEDRRARPLFLTPKGEELMAYIRSHRAQLLKFFLSGLTPVDQEKLVDLLEQAVNAMESSLTNEASEDQDI